MNRYGAGNDGCMWNPDRNRHVWSNEAHYLERRATVILGSRKSWRLCESCSRLPVFSRLRKRVPITRRTTPAEPHVEGSND